MIISLNNENPSLLYNRHRSRLLKPRTHNQVFLEKFSLRTSLQQKLTIFSLSLTRSLVQKLVTPAYEEGKLFVCTADKEPKLDKELCITSLLTRLQSPLQREFVHLKFRSCKLWHFRGQIQLFPLWLKALRSRERKRSHASSKIVGMIKLQGPDSSECANIVVRENLSTRTHKQIKLVKERLRGETCSLYTRVSKATKELDVK